MKVYLGLGGNLGDPKTAIREALRRLESRGLGRVRRVSSFYLTEPAEMKDQPWFINAAAELSTDREVREFMAGLREIEKEFGREPHRPKNAPRTLDLDLLLWGNQALSFPDLVVPHPRMHLRKFVLAPLAEIAPHALHPGLGRTAAELLRDSTDHSRVEKCPAETEDGHE